MTPIQYTIQVDLSASKESIWQAITQFDAYPKWNTVLSMAGNDSLEIGKKFHVTIYGGKTDSKFTATTLSSKADESFAAQQKIVGKWFFSATHHFIIEASGEGARFIQHWELTGIISRVFRKDIFKQLELFKRMNHELKMYLEPSRTR
ncbi:MAG: SRPBCC domain-containing protein [Bacteroidota bacterium]